MNFAKFKNKKIIKNKSKANQGIGIIKKLYNVLLGNSLIIIYKLFIQPHHYYGVIIFDQPENESFCKKIKFEVMWSSSREKVYKELGLKTVKPRSWLKKKKCYITTYSCITDAFKYSCFPLMINEWNKLNFDIGTSSFNINKTSLIKIFQPIPYSVYCIFNPQGLKLITRLSLDQIT